MTKGTTKIHVLGKRWSHAAHAALPRFSAIALSAATFLLLHGPQSRVAAPSPKLGSCLGRATASPRHDAHFGRHEQNKRKNSHPGRVRDTQNVCQFWHPKWEPLLAIHFFQPAWKILSRRLAGTGPLPPRFCLALSSARRFTSRRKTDGERRQRRHGTEMDLPAVRLLASGPAG